MRIAALLMLAASAAGAQTALVIQHSGRLWGENDVPVQGAVALTFSLYATEDAHEGETSLWRATYTVTAFQGVYAVELGKASGQALAPDLFPGDAPRYLAIQVGDGEEMTPRLKIGIAPLALNALRLGGRPASDYALAEDLADLAGTSGSTSLTTVGTITAGTWQGTPVADAYVAGAAKWDAKLDAVSHDGSLAGSGAAGTPLGVVFGTTGGTAAAGNDARFSTLDAKFGDYLTSAAAASAYQAKGDYLTTTAAANAYQPKGNYLTAPASSVSGSFTVVNDPDPATVLLLKGDGDPLVDSSSRRHLITVNGSVSSSTAQSRFGGRSIRLGASGKGWFSIPWHQDFAVPASMDFTVDYWINFDSSQPSAACERVFQFGANLNNAWGHMFCEAGSNLFFGYDGYNDPNGVVTPINPLLGTGWHHLAIVRSGSTLKMYVDGAEVSSKQNPGLQNVATETMYFSTYPGEPGTSPTAYYIIAYLDEFRISRGVARWTSAFTPPTVEYPAASTRTITVTNGIVTAIQ
jgi:hypothetical protein